MLPHQADGSSPTVTPKPPQRALLGGSGHNNGRLAAALLALLVCLALAPDPSHEGRPTGVQRPEDLRAVASWTYQLQAYPNRLNEIAAANFQLAVVDPSEDGSSKGRWAPAEVAAARRNKLLLAYLSVGEAETYRTYWQPTWRPGTPTWLGLPNADWPDNYQVRYWDPDWQRLILQALDDILAQGFDGAYLDVVDGYATFPGRSSAKADMVHFICRLRQYARAQNPKFLIVPQNAAELIWERGYGQCIDGTGQEETFFGATNRATTNEERTERLRHYTEYLRLHKAVLTVDYVDTSEGIREVYTYARLLGLIPYATTVELNELRINAGYDPPVRRGQER